MTSILRMLAYAMLPSIVTLIFLIAEIGIYGIEMFKSDTQITSTDWISTIFLFGAIFLQVILGIWTIVFFVVGLSEVQKFSIGKSILNLLLALALVLFPIVMLILLFKGF